MCCIFTCCGWMIDLVQRLWTFTMSCCISSAVCCVMLTSSMSGIALGYNYSLAEYIDLKETNVSVYLKRGVFDDEIADDMDWRRAGRMPVAGHLGKDNLMTGAPEDDDSTPLRSGRRLDDSVFEADDQNKYEGSLMKLTAKAPFLSTEGPLITDDVQMAEYVSKHPSGSLDQMKAIQSLIDSRRTMGTGGTTMSPLATYNVNERNLPYFPMYANPDSRGVGGRRMMPPEEHVPGLSPARMAVPDQSIGSPNNWLIPKMPHLFNMAAMPDYFVLSPTYPTPITLNTGPIRVTRTTTPVQGGVMFVTRTIATTESKSRADAVLATMQKETQEFNEKYLLESDLTNKQDFKKILKMGSKTSEEEYEDEIKGLPVRKRRSLKVKPLASNASISTIRNDTNINNDTKNSSLQQVSNNNTNTNDISSSNTEVTISNKTFNNIIQNDVVLHQINNFTNTRNDRNMKEGNENTAYHQMISNENLTSDINNKVKSTSKQNIRDVNENIRENTLLNSIMTIIGAKKLTLTAEKRRPERIKNQNIRKAFESRIVSSKYGTNSKRSKLADTETKTISTAEILNSISINLNEAGLLRNPATSNFVRLLQSTLT